MKTLTVAAIAMLALPAFAAEPASLTVEQALNIGNGLGQLGKAEAPGADGKPFYYQFSGEVRMLMAVNIDLSRQVQGRFERALNEIRMQFSPDGSGNVPEDKKAQFTVDVAKIAAASSIVSFRKIKVKDLCLDAAPPECPVANKVPASILSLLIPILDDTK